MKESLGISQEQKQVQRLTPQQVQFGKMLEMSQLEIEEKVRQEIEDNPAIEVASPAESEKMLTEDGEVFKESSQDMQLADFRDMDDMPDGYDTAHTAGTPESENPAERSSEIPSYRLKENNYSPDDKVYEPTIVSENSLIDFLTEQVNERNLTDEQMQIADYIIGEIDDNGYLTRTVPSMASDIAFQTGLDISDEEVANVLQIIRDLDPAGVAATDLRDCLLLQLERLGGSKRNMHAYEIIDKHFEECHHPVGTRLHGGNTPLRRRRQHAAHHSRLQRRSRRKQRDAHTAQQYSRPADRADLPADVRRTFQPQGRQPQRGKGERVRKRQIRIGGRIHQNAPPAAGNPVQHDAGHRQLAARLLPVGRRSDIEAHGAEGHFRHHRLRHLCHFPGNGRKIRQYTTRHLPYQILLQRRS